MGMSKERTSLSLDPEVAQYLRQDSVNASGLVNELVSQHMNGGATEDMIRDFRIKQVRSELEDINSRAERKREELETLVEIDEGKSEEQQQQLEEARQTLVDTAKEPDNPAIKNWARDLGMSPQELIEKLEEDE